MKTMSTSNVETYTRLFLKDRAAADRYWARCMGQDAAMDDETVEKLKEFLKSKLTAEDHETVCSMMDGVDAQDTEPYRSDPDETPRGKLAGDAASFHSAYPGAARIKVDTSGLVSGAKSV